MQVLLLRAMSQLLKVVAQRSFYSIVALSFRCGSFGWTSNLWLKSVVEGIVSCMV